MMFLSITVIDQWPTLFLVCVGGVVFYVFYANFYSNIVTFKIMLSEK